MRRSLILLLALLCVQQPARAVSAVEALALMRDRAVLWIDGAQRQLVVGQTSPEGVTLVSATPTLAVVRIGEKELDLALSRRVGANYQAPKTREVRVSRNPQGQFRVGGAIDGRPVLFLVDTGATILAMSSEHAVALGIDYATGGTAGHVVTAAGNAESHFVTLDTVQVGGITVHGVQAAVVEGAYPVDILLGMSFLRHVGMSENAGVLTLQQKQ